MILILLKKDSETKAFVSPTDEDNVAIDEALALAGWDNDDYDVDITYIDETTEIFIS